MHRDFIIREIMPLELVSESCKYVISLIYNFGKGYKKIKIKDLIEIWCAIKKTDEENQSTNAITRSARERLKELGWIKISWDGLEVKDLSKAEKLELVERGIISENKHWEFTDRVTEEKILEALSDFPLPDNIEQILIDHRKYKSKKKRVIKEIMDEFNIDKYQAFRYLIEYAIQAWDQQRRR